MHEANSLKNTNCEGVTVFQITGSNFKYILRRATLAVWVFTFSVAQ